MNPVPPLEPGCPWYEISQLAPPNIKWCEASLCSWITEPANTWSNLAYILAAVLIAKTAKEMKSSTMKRVAVYVFWVGAFSFIYHASYNFFTQFFDFFGMYLISFLALNINFMKLGWLTKEKEKKVFWISVVVALLLTLTLKFLEVPYQGIILFLVVANLIFELTARQRLGNWIRMKYFWWCQAAMVVAFVFSVLDAKRIFCDPHNHWLQGHALWHCFAAFSFVLWSKHLKQFVGKYFD